MWLLDRPSFFNPDFLPRSSGIPWYSPYTSGIADLPASWSPGSSSWAMPSFSLGLGALGIPYGTPVAALWAAWVMASNFPWGVNQFGSPMYFRPPARAAGAGRGEGGGPQFSRVPPDLKGEEDELDGAGDAEADAGAPAGPGRTTDITKLTDWNDGDREAAKRVRAAAKRAANGHDKYTVTVRFGPKQKQVTIYAAPKKTANPAPTAEDRTAIETALKGLPRRGLNVHVVVEQAPATGGATPPALPDPGGATTAATEANKEYKVAEGNESKQVCEIVVRGNEVSVNILIQPAGNNGRVIKPIITRAQTKAREIAKKFHLTSKL